MDGIYDVLWMNYMPLKHSPSSMIRNAVYIIREQYIFFNI